jgi:hypothetical protein
VSIEEQGGQSRIYFQVPYFVDFLFPRVVLIPYLKRSLVTKGGLYLLGSCFSYQDTTFVLFGYPGCGKTRLMLDALNVGAHCVGDNGLVVLDGAIQSAYDEIELRYYTVRKSLFWHRLAFGKQLRLVLFHWLSVLSRRTISFNVSLPLADLEIGTRSAPRQQKSIFIWLGHPFRKLALSEAVAAVVQYEQRYRDLYGEVFLSDAYLRRLGRNASDFLAGCPSWCLPSECNISDVLQLARTTE